MKHHLCVPTLAAALLALPVALPAIIVGPYTPDAQTLHLWHMDTEGVPVPDEVSPGGNALTALGGGATLGNPSFPGFGAALSTLDGGQDSTDPTGRDAYLACLPLVNGPADNVTITLADPVTGAFTMEAVVWIGFDPSLNLGSVGNGGNGRGAQCQIMAGEDEANPGRIFQFRIDPIGTASPLNLSEPMLEFINVRQAAGGQVQNILAPIPMTGDDAIVSNGWFHVAVTYNGNAGEADNLKLYWTRMESTRIEANLIGTATMMNDLSVASNDFSIGNIGRNPSQNAFLGLIDEVRISKVARGAGQMMFAGPNITFDVQPANTVAAVGQPFSLSVTASGIPPLSYQWRKGGAPIPGATDSTYSVASATADDAGTYDVVVSNLISLPATSASATVTIRTTVDSLVWLGFSDGNWDTVSPNWKNAATQVQPVNYQTGDHVRFNDEGAWWWAPIQVVGTLFPGSVTVDPTVEWNNYIIGGSGTLAGSMALTKAGPSTLSLDGLNTYTGPTLISGGVLQIGAGGATGTLGAGPVTNQSILAFNRTGSLLVPNRITGSGALSNVLGTTILTGTDNAWTGGTIVLGGSLQVGNGGANGSLGGGAIVVDGNLTFNSALDCTVAQVIEGVGTLTKAGTGTLTLSAANSYLGATAANGGTLLVRNGGALGSTDGNTVIAGNVGAVSRVALENQVAVAEPFLLSGRQPAPDVSALAGHLVNLSGTNTLTGPITATTGGNQYNIESAGGRLVMAGEYSQVAGTGERFLNLQGAGDAEWSGPINNGTAIVVLLKRGAGTWTLSSVNGYTGATLVSEGTLLINGSIASPAVNVTNTGTLGGAGTISAPVTVGDGGTLGPGASIGTLTITGSLTLEPGSTTRMEIHPAASTRDQIVGVTSLTYGGQLVIANLGGVLTTNDSFKLFTAETYSGDFASVSPAPGPVLAWDTSTLTTDGTLRIKIGANPEPAPITYSLDGDQLTLSWPADRTGWLLQEQTTDLGVGIGDNWVDVPGSTLVNEITVTVDPNVGCRFYRLVLP